MDMKLVVSLSALGLTFCTLLGGIIYRMGGLNARVDALEAWRTGIRLDMHEISSKLESVVVSIRELSTLIEERTDRRRGRIVDMTLTKDS